MEERLLKVSRVKLFKIAAQRPAIVLGEGRRGVAQGPVYLGAMDSWHDQPRPDLGLRSAPTQMGT